MIVDFIYDVATPNGYLAHKVIPEFEKRTNTSFNYVPCLAGGIFKLTNNTPPLIANADVKNKAEYFFVEMNESPLRLIQHFFLFQLNISHL